MARDHMTGDLFATPRPAAVTPGSLPTIDLSAFTEPTIATKSNSELVIETIDGVSVDLHLWGKLLSVDFGNQVATKEYTEHKETGISVRSPTFTMRFARPAKADFDPQAVSDDLSIITAYIKVSEPDGRYSMLAIRGQIENVNDTDVDGDFNYEITGICIPSSTGGDEFYIEFGDDTFAINGDELLRLGQQVYASGDPYFSLRDTIMAMLEQVAALPATAPTGTGGGGGTTEIAASAELEALYAERDRLLAEQTAAERLALAQELTTIIRDLVIATGDPLSEIAESLGLSMTALIADLGINLEDLTTTTASQLADVAQMTGTNLTELAASVGADLGNLSDAQSLMNDALEAEIAALPQEQRDQLAPLLRAVEEAAALGDTAGVEAGVIAMEASINDLAPQLRDALAPYFDGVQPVDYTQLDALSFIDLNTHAAAESLAAHTDILTRIADNLHASNSAAGLPAYATGTAYVPRTGPALIHEGEMILPAPVARFLRQGNASGGSDRLIAVLQEEHRLDREDNQRIVQQLLARIQQLETAVAAGANKKATAINNQTDAMRGRR